MHPPPSLSMIFYLFLFSETFNFLKLSLTTLKYFLVIDLHKHLLSRAYSLVFYKNYGVINHHRIELFCLRFPLLWSRLWCIWAYLKNEHSIVYLLRCRTMSLGFTSSGFAGAKTRNWVVVMRRIISQGSLAEIAVGATEEFQLLPFVHLDHFGSRRVDGSR